jgi:hypothetical protein
VVRRWGRSVRRPAGTRDREVVEHLRAAGHFAEDGGFEIPYLPSVGIAPRYIGRREIESFLHLILKLYRDWHYQAEEYTVVTTILSWPPTSWPQAQRTRFGCASRAARAAIRPASRAASIFLKSSRPIAETSGSMIAAT